jgi:hypothetical protein
MRPQKKFVFSLVAVKRTYDILDDDQPVALVSYLKNKGGEVVIDGKQFPIVRGGGPSVEVLGELIVRKATGRPRVPASYTLTEADGRPLFVAEHLHSKEGFAVTRGEEKYRYRKPKGSKQRQLFRDGEEQPLLANAGLSPSSEFDLPFQVFLKALEIALLEEEPDSSPVSSI